MEFELTLKNTKLKGYYLMGWLIIFLNLIAQTGLVFGNIDYQDQKIYPAVVVVLILFVIAAFGNRKIDRRTAIGIVITFIIFLWLKWNIWLFAALNVVLYFFFFIATRKLGVVVTEKNITYPSFPAREIEWKELQNIVIKDGVLTIDFKNNKLLQAEIEDLPNENKFNEFCKTQLVK